MKHDHWPPRRPAEPPTLRPTDPQPNEEASEIEGYSQFYDAGVGAGVDLGADLGAHVGAHAVGVAVSDAPYESPWGEDGGYVNGRHQQGGYQHEYDDGRHGLQSTASPSNYAVSELSHPEGGGTLQDEYQTLAQPVDGVDASPTPTSNTEQIHKEETVG